MIYIHTKVLHMTLLLEDKLTRDSLNIDALRELEKNTELEAYLSTQVKLR